jgi:hypothetical protein
VKPGHVWRALFPGTCAECGEPFQADTRITSKPGIGYAHAACPDDQPAKPTKFEGSTLEEMGF